MKVSEIKKKIPTDKQIRKTISSLVSEDKQQVRDAQTELLSDLSKIQAYLNYFITKYGDTDTKTKELTVDISKMLQTPSLTDLTQLKKLYKEVKSEASSLENSKPAQNVLGAAIVTAGVSKTNTISAVLSVLSVEAGTKIKKTLDKSLNKEYKRELSRSEPITRAVKASGQTDSNSNPRTKIKQTSDDPLNKVKYGMNKRQLGNLKDNVVSKDELNNDFDSVYWNNISKIGQGAGQFFKDQVTYNGGLNTDVVKKMLWSDLQSAPLGVRKPAHNLSSNIRTQKAVVKNRATVAYGLSRGIKKWTIVTMNDNNVCSLCQGASAGGAYTYTQLVENGYYPVIHDNDRCDFEPEFDDSQLDELK